MIGAAILGILAGFLARALVPGKQEMGFFATVLVGLGGALIGFFVFTELLGIGDTEIFDLGGLVGAVIGSMVLLLLYERFISSRSSSSSAAPAAAKRDQGRAEPAARRSGQDRPGESGRRPEGRDRGEDR